MASTGQELDESQRSQFALDFDTENNVDVSWVAVGHLPRPLNTDDSPSDEDSRTFHDVAVETVAVVVVAAAGESSVHIASSSYLWHLVRRPLPLVPDYCSELECCSFSSTTLSHYPELADSYFHYYYYYAYYLDSDPRFPSPAVAFAHLARAGDGPLLPRHLK